MEYPSYLVHFNRNHSPKNGQFASGDGDGDGTSDERGRHGRYKPEAIGNGDQPQTQYVNKTMLKLGVGAGKWIAGKAFARTKLGKQFNQIKSDWISVGRYALANTDLKKAMKSSNWSNYSKELATKKNKFTDKMYDKATNAVNKGLDKYMGG